ncbi:MAG: hypothetical protein KC983_01055 [Phycisphaerales bacterium]|nr:hypothetical protein [Phycisphaerales bacterium]
MFDALRSYLRARASESDRIDPERRCALCALGDLIRDSRHGQRTPRLLFVCTHNSRRSQIGQVMAHAAAAAVELDVETYSCGTEVTAFNPRAVAAVQRAGCRIAVIDPATHDNPIVEVQISENGPVLRCFSKRFDDPSIPTDDLIAIMVCSSADAACPILPGATDRLAIRYDDPKSADDTDEETATYDACCARIAREMMFVMRRVAGQAVV